MAPVSESLKNRKMSKTTFKEAAMKESGFFQDPISPQKSPQFLMYPTVPDLLSPRTMVLDGCRSITAASSPPPRPKRPNNLLTTIMEKQPRTYQPTLPSRSMSSDRPNDDSDNDDTTSEPSLSYKPRATTTSSGDSVTSHPGGVIYIKPSPQLQSMQAVKEHVRELGDTTPYGPWTRSNVYSTHSTATLPMASYVPSGTPLTIFKTLGNVDIDATEDTRPTPRPSQMFEIAKEEHDWSEVRDWAEPSTVVEGPTQWIEGFLERKAEADRLESEAHSKPGRIHQKCSLNRVDSLKQVNKLMRKLSSSGKKTAEACCGFDPRQERARRQVPSSRQQLAQDQQSLLCSQGSPHMIDVSGTRNLPRPGFNITEIERPTLKRRFHTVSGASFSKYLLRKVQLRQLDPDGDEMDVQRSLSVNLGRRASVRVKGLVRKWESLGGKSDRDERNRRDSVSDAGRELADERYFV